jgi:hypothetical protein
MNISFVQARHFLLAVLFSTMTVAGPGDTFAEEVDCDNVSEFPCSIQMEQVKLQKVPAIFKFQARVSQAKLPIGKGEFPTVFVKLVNANQVLCIEQFENVKIEDSVLNLDIGNNMNCEIHEVIAENTNLGFKICLGSQDNCLKKIELGSVPYAVKASFAAIAQNAHNANVAAQAHYAHRVTADRDLFVRHKLGTGYFDFHTHSDGGSLYGDVAYADHENDGFLQWTPTRDTAATKLHISAKSQATDHLHSLGFLYLHADTTMVHGDLEIDTDARVGGRLLGIGTNDLTVGSPDLAGTVVLDDKVVVTQDLSVHTIHNPGGAMGGVVSVPDDVAIEDSLEVGQQVTAGSLQTISNAAVGGSLSVAGATTLGNTYVSGELANASEDAPLLFNDDVTITGNTTMGAANKNLVVNSPTTFNGLVTFEHGTQSTEDAAKYDALYVNTSGEQEDITLEGQLYVLQTIATQGDFNVEGHIYNDGGQALWLYDESGIILETTPGVDVTCKHRLNAQSDVNIVGDLYNDSGKSPLALTDDDGVYIGAYVGSGGATVKQKNSYVNNDDLNSLLVTGLPLFAEVGLGTQGNFNVEGGIYNDGGASVLIDDQVTVTGVINATAGIRNTTDSDAGAVYINDAAYVNGDLTTQGKLNVESDIYNDSSDKLSLKDADGIVLDGPVEVKEDVVGLTATLTDCEYITNNGDDTIVCPDNKVIRWIDFDSLAEGGKDPSIQAYCCAITVK